MDSFKFNSLNYQDNTSLVDAQNKVIDDLIKDNKVLTQDQANYATFRAKESQKQLEQLGNIIAGVPKLKKEIEAAKERKEATAEFDYHEKESVKRSKLEKSNTDPTPTQETELEDESKKLKRDLTGIVNDKNTEESVKTVVKKELTKADETKTINRNTAKYAIDLGLDDSHRFWGEGEAYPAVAERGQIQEVRNRKKEYLITRMMTEDYKNLSPRNRRKWYDTFNSQFDNYMNQAGRAWTAKSNTIYIDNRRNGLLEDIKIDPGKAIEDYIFENELFGTEKNTGAAISQLIGDLEALEKDGLMNSKLYGQILSGKLTDRSSNTSKEVRELNNRFSTWIEGRRATLISQENREELAKDTQALKDDIEETEIRFEEWQQTNQNATVEDEKEWREQELVGLFKRHKKFPAGHELYQPYLTGMTRLDGPDHSITLTRLLDDHRKGAPLDDTMYQSLPSYWKNQFQKAIGGTDGEEGSSGESIGTGKLTFKSYFNALKEGGGWHSHIMDKMKISDVNAARSNPKFGWILFQGQEDYVTKFEELKKIGSVRDAQAGALAFIKGKYQEYYDNPIDEGFDTRITSSITEGRRDIIPRLRGKSQDDKLAVLNQPTFWDGEEVAFEELMKWSKGYGEFPQYYRQVDDNLFKDMTPRDIALHRMEINKERIEKKEDFNNALKAIYKGVELDNKLYNSLPLDTSRLLTNHNTASRTYRAEVQEKDNTELYEHVKVNDDPNAYTLTNPYILERPSDNLSEKSLMEVLKESANSRINTLGLYGLNPKNIMSVISEEEKTNGFLNTTFDEELQTELKRRLARLSANRANQYSALTENPNPLPNLIEEDNLTLTEMFGPQDWYSIPPNTLQMYLKEMQKN